MTFVENGGADRHVVWDAGAGAAITYPDAADVGFTGPGTTLLGWSTDRAATTADPAFDRLAVSTVTGDVVLHAVWTTPAVELASEVLAADGPVSDGPVSGAPVVGRAAGGLASTGGELTLLWAVGALVAAGVAIRRGAARRRSSQA